MRFFLFFFEPTPNKYGGGASMKKFSLEGSRRDRRYSSVGWRIIILNDLRAIYE